MMHGQKNIKLGNGVVIYAWQTTKDGPESYPSYFKVASNNIP